MFVRATAQGCGKSTASLATRITLPSHVSLQLIRLVSTTKSTSKAGIKPSSKFSAPRPVKSKPNQPMVFMRDPQGRTYAKQAQRNQLMARIKAAKQRREEMEQQLAQADQEQSEQQEGEQWEGGEEEGAQDIVEEEEEGEVVDGEGEAVTTGTGNPQDLYKSKRNKPYHQYLLRYKIGTVALPKELQLRIQKLLKGTSTQHLKYEGHRLSKILRARTTTNKAKDQEEQKKLSEDEKALAKQDKRMQEYEDKKAKIDPNRDLKISYEEHFPTPPKPHIDQPPPVYNQNQALAYVATRMPGIYACNYRVFSEVSQNLPDFHPESMLDFGTGPGTAIWAAREVWSKCTDTLMSVEPSTAMMEVAEKILEDFGNVQWRRFLFNTKATTQFQLVTASYVLSEMKSDGERRQTVQNLWDSCAPGGVMILIEPGTPIGFNMIRDARRQLLVELDDPLHKAAVIGPCPHASNCPMAGGDWCHFIQRMQRIPLQLGSKLGASINWEDEKFSYIAVQKKEQSATTDAELRDMMQKRENWGKILRTPLKRGGHVILDTCTHTGDAKRQIVSKASGRLHYSAARKSGWGDVFVFPSRRTLVNKQNLIETAKWVRNEEYNKEVEKRELARSVRALKLEERRRQKEAAEREKKEKEVAEKRKIAKAQQQQKLQELKQKVQARKNNPQK